MLAAATAARRSDERWRHDDADCRSNCRTKSLKMSLWLTLNFSVRRWFCIHASAVCKLLADEVTSRATSRSCWINRVWQRRRTDKIPQRGAKCMQQDVGGVDSTANEIRRIRAVSHRNRTQSDCRRGGADCGREPAAQAGRPAAVSSLPPCRFVIDPRRRRSGQLVLFRWSISDVDRSSLRRPQTPASVGASLNSDVVVAKRRNIRQLLRRASCGANENRARRSPVRACWQATRLSPIIESVAGALSANRPWTSTQTAAAGSADCRAKTSHVRVRPRRSANKVTEPMMQCVRRVMRRYHHHTTRHVASFARRLRASRIQRQICVADVVSDVPAVFNTLVAALFLALLFMPYINVNRQRGWRHHSLCSGAKITYESWSTLHKTELNGTR